MAIYPKTFPCPMIEGYSIDVDAGLVRSKERGLPAQRRTFTTMPQTVKCKFSLSLHDWGYWQEWVRRDGLGWFYIDIPSMYSGYRSARVFPHLVRFTAPFTIDTKSSTHVTASCVLEMSPTNFLQFLDLT